MVRRRKSHSRGASRGHGPGAPQGRGKKPPRGRTRRGPPNRTGRERPRTYEAYEKEPATPEYMARLFSEHGIALREEELERYWRYYELLKEHNRHLELTRIIGIEATVLKHFIDCLLVADMVELPPPVLDIGSGPGFPGAPIAIRRPELPVILAESRGKRVRFLEKLVGELGLENVRVHGRSVTTASDLTAGSVVTRALEVIPATLARVKELVPPGGLCVLMKGPNCGQEISDAQEQFRGVWTMREDFRYALPETTQQRRLVVFARRDGSASD